MKQDLLTNTLLVRFSWKHEHRPARFGPLSGEDTAPWSPGLRPLLSPNQRQVEAILPHIQSYWIVQYESTTGVPAPRRPQRLRVGHGRRRRSFVDAREAPGHDLSSRARAAHKSFSRITYDSHAPGYGMRSAPRGCRATSRKPALNIQAPLVSCQVLGCRVSQLVYGEMMDLIMRIQEGCECPECPECCRRHRRRHRNRRARDHPSLRPAAAFGGPNGQLSDGHGKSFGPINPTSKYLKAAAVPSVEQPSVSSLGGDKIDACTEVCLVIGSPSSCDFTRGCALLPPSGAPLGRPHRRFECVALLRRLGVAHSCFCRSAIPRHFHGYSDQNLIRDLPTDLIIVHSGLPPAPAQPVSATR